MGRPTGALAKPDPVMVQAQWLKSLRLAAGLSLRQMAQKTTGQDWTVTHTKLFRAEQGIKPPKWQTVRAYIEECDGNAYKAQRLWNAAADAVARTAARAEPVTAARTVLPPEHISEPLELLHAMRAMRKARGYRSLRELEDAARVDGVSFLPHSTLGAVLSGKRMVSKQMLLCLVGVCTGAGPDSTAMHAWARAWDRADAHRRGRRARTAVASILDELESNRAELLRTREELARRTAPGAAIPAGTDAEAHVHADADADADADGHAETDVTITVTVTVTDGDSTPPGSARPSKPASAWRRFRALVGTALPEPRSLPMTNMLVPRPATSP
ncbi:hypothetical protein [Embleya sp. NPDC020886]|uniref:hypothetical protein n=1 Tax=Embleya sp. NPDC020886 TaxID=3363980 RepID=UPI00378D7FBB